jgi:hypothetical protein
VSAASASGLCSSYSLLAPRLQKPMGKSSSDPAQLSARAQPDLDPLLFAVPSLGRPVQVGGESVEVLEASSAMLSAPAPSVLPVPVPPAKPATSASALAAAVLASRKAEPAIGGRLTQAAPSSCPSMAPAAMAVPEGANVKLSVPEVSSSPVPASCPASGSTKEDDCLSRGICWPVSWVSAADAADDDEDGEDVLPPRRRLPPRPLQMLQMMPRRRCWLPAAPLMCVLMLPAAPLMCVLMRRWA